MWRRPSRRSVSGELAQLADADGVEGQERGERRPRGIVGVEQRAQCGEVDRRGNRAPSSSVSRDGRFVACAVWLAAGGCCDGVYLLDTNSGTAAEMMSPASYTTPSPYWVADDGSAAIFESFHATYVRRRPPDSG
jgi:hypothetical protein